MSDKARKILVTSALPYANGALHMGHLVEYLQTDIWVRFQKLRGHTCTYVCASDAHGTPIMLKARELGITPEQLTEQVSAEFVRDFRDFGVNFDNYHTTHSAENEALTIEMYEALKARGDIYTKSIDQAYDEKEGMFLPDRFVRGTCPRCKSPDQYGDACEVCGATYSPGDLIDAVSVVRHAAGHALVGTLLFPSRQLRRSPAPLDAAGATGSQCAGQARGMVRRGIEGLGYIP